MLWLVWFLILEYKINYLYKSKLELLDSSFLFYINKLEIIKVKTIVILSLLDEELLEAFKSLSGIMLKDSADNDEMIDILMLQDGINCIIVGRWVEKHEGK